MARFASRLAPIVLAVGLLGACSSTPAATTGGLASSASPGGSASAAANAQPSGGPSASSPAAPASQPGGGAAGNPPTHVCDLISNADITAVTGGSVTKTDPFVNETFPQCVWSLKDATKVGTALKTVLVAFALPTIFDHNDTTGRVDVTGLGEAAYAYPPGQSVLKISGAELWVRTHGLVMRIYSVPVDFQILNDPEKTKTWTSQSLALNRAIAELVIAKL